MKKCKFCGTQVEDLHNYCFNCGCGFVTPDYCPKLLEAFRFEKAGKIDEAIESYLDVIRRNPSDGEPYKHLGNVYYRLGRLDDAIEEYKKSIELLPSFPTTYYDCGVAYYMKSMQDEAIRYFRKTLDLNPKFIMAWYRLGICYERSSRWIDAKQAFNFVLQLHKGIYIAYYHLGVIEWHLNEPDLAIENFEKVLVQNPRDIDSLHYLGFLYSMKGFYGRAIACFKSIMEYDPLNKEARQQIEALSSMFSPL
jgi:tetratricopeptide (TPR) repeat protein